MCTYRLNWAKRTYGDMNDGDMNEVTLPSRHMIRNSSSGGLRPSTPPLGHGGWPQYWIFTSERSRNILFLWNLHARLRFEPANSDFPSKQLYPLHQGPRPRKSGIYSLHTIKWHNHRLASSDKWTHFTCFTLALHSPNQYKMSWPSCLSSNWFNRTHIMDYVILHIDQFICYLTTCESGMK